jgi:hypothetical protein
MQTLSLRVGGDEAHGLDSQDPVSSQRYAMLIMVLTGAALPKTNLISCFACQYRAHATPTIHEIR